MIGDVVKARVHQAKERIGGEMFPSCGRNVCHRQSCPVNSPSVTYMGYFRTYRYAKATERLRWFLDCLARRELLTYQDALGGVVSWLTAEKRTCQSSAETRILHNL